MNQILLHSITMLHHRRSAALELVAPLCYSGGMTADQIARLTIALDEMKPPVRRRIEVPLAIRLDRLHQVFQIAMGWENCHLYEFRVGRDIAYGIPDPNGISSERAPDRQTEQPWPSSWRKPATTRSNTSTISVTTGNTPSSSKPLPRPNPKPSIRVCSRPKAAARPRISVGRGAMPNILKLWPTPTTNAMPRWSNGAAPTSIPIPSMKPPSENS
jgi:hypothetical protein